MGKISVRVHLAVQVIKNEGAARGCLRGFLNQAQGGGGSRRRGVGVDERIKGVARTNAGAAVDERVGVAQRAGGVVVVYAQRGLVGEAGAKNKATVARRYSAYKPNKSAVVTAVRFCT